MIRRILLIATRDFLATVLRKGFLFGILLMPVLGVLMGILVPKILAGRSPPVQGEVRLIDQSGVLGMALGDALKPTAIEARRAARRQQLIADTAPQLERAPDTTGLSASVPNLTLRMLAADADLEAQKASLRKDQDKRPDALAIIVIAPDAVQRTEGTTNFGGYQIYASTALNDDTETVLREALAATLVTARLQSAGIDPDAIEAAQRVARKPAVIVGEKGEQNAQRNFNRILPFVMGALLFISVMLCGQTLMTSLIEEKSSRVVEVLLSAVSPLELMWGKLLAQLAVGLLVMLVYIGLGVLLLLQFALFGLLDPMLILYVVVFFLLAYLVFGALLMAIGAAVNQVADAQSLMGPVVMLMLVPYALSPIVGRNPDAPLSVVMSLLPPVNSFVMMVRLASDSPPPIWQVVLSIGVGVLGAAVAVWFAAKIFRIGLLMHGKPPNFATLLRWARQA